MPWVGWRHAALEQAWDAHYARRQAALDAAVGLQSLLFPSLLVHEVRGRPP